MSRSRPRRNVRRAVMAMVLLPVLYVASVFSAAFAFGTGWLPAPVMKVMELVYAPLGWYVKNEYPGSDSLEWAVNESERLGDRLAN